MAGGLSTAMVLLNMRFSRDFEAQADDYATDLLRKSGRSPELFASSLALLDEAQKIRGIDNGYSFLSTRPAPEERIARARAAARASPPQHAKSEAHADAGASENESNHDRDQ